MRPVLHGPRFEGGSVPFELLRDLAVLEELVVEVAKHRFLQAHERRRRVPRGFTARVELRLTRIEDGSAAVAIDLVVPADLLPETEPERRYAFEARDAIVNGIAAAAAGRAIADHLPAAALSYFDRLGRGLRDGEWIEFHRDRDPSPVRFDREVRRRLVLASPTAKELTEETSVRGRIPEADQHVSTFQLMLPEGRKIKAPIEAPHLDLVLEAFNGWRQGQSVEIRGVGRFDRNNRLLSLDSVHDITLLDPLDVVARLDEIAALSDGWLDGEGMAPSRAGTEWLASWLSASEMAEFPMPRLYPTPEGGVQAEWTLGTVEISLEIDLVRRRGTLHRLDLASNGESELDLELESPEAAQQLARELRDAEASSR